jgi:hypothetical protein
MVMQPVPDGLSRLAMGENLKRYLDNMVCCETAAGQYFGDDKYIAPATARLNELLE